MIVRRNRAELGVDVATGLVVASVAVALAGLTWRLAGGTDPAASLAPAPAAPAGPPPPADLAAVNSFAPFGRPPATAAGPTSLGLELRGVLLAIPRSASIALIATPGAKPVSYRVGQSVSGGATIEEIARDHVVLRVGGQAELLAFAKRGAAAGAPAAPQPAPAGPPPVVITPTPPTPPSGEPLLGPSGIAPSAFLQNLGATPSDEGYVIGQTSSPALQRAGVRPGDVIASINGSPVGDEERDRQTLGAAALAGSARVEVVRDGRRLTLTVPLR